MIDKNSFDGQLVFKGEKKFNNLSNRSNHYKKDKLQLINFSKKIKNKKYQKIRKCQVCNSNSYNLLFKKDNFCHVMCKKCTFVYVTPSLRDDVHFNSIANESSYVNVLKNSVNLKLDKRKFLYGLEKLKVKKKKKILDIGCAYGSFLEVAKIKKLNVYGAEINKHCVKVLKRKKIELINLEKTKIKFDYITLWTVFEHISEANKVLKKLFNLLNKNGKLLINVPNVESLSAKIMHESCTMFSGEQHVNLFSKITLEKILTNNKFKILGSETIISDIERIKNYLSYGFGKKINLPFLNPNFIHKNMLGYTLLTIAQK